MDTSCGNTEAYLGLFLLYVLYSTVYTFIKVYNICTTQAKINGQFFVQEVLCFPCKIYWCIYVCVNICTYVCIYIHILGLLLGLLKPKQFTLNYVCYRSAEHGVDCFLLCRVFLIFLSRVKWYLFTCLHHLIEYFTEKSVDQMF